MPTRSKKKSPQGIWAVLARPFIAIKKRIDAYVARRPHRSFRLTKRRDAVRPLELPGNIAFTYEVNKTVWKYKKQLGALGIIYLLFYAVLIGIGSQDTYLTITDTLKETGTQVIEGDLSQIGQTGLLFASILTIGIDSATTEAQQIFGALLILLVWLSSVWLLRNVMAGRKVTVRDSLYNSGAPLVSTLLVSLVLVIQLLPVGFAILGYTAALASGLLQGGVEAMLFWFAAGLLGVLSLFWIISTFFALIIVTLPGMYPFRALRIAGDLVLGRRIPILLRFLWMALMLVVGWAAVLIPVIFIDLWLKAAWPAIEWLPVVPVALLVVATATVVWSSTYIYMLYRKIVAKDADK